MNIRIFVLAFAVAVYKAIRWFVRTANGAKGYGREPLPSSVADYRGLRINTEAETVASACPDR